MKNLSCRRPAILAILIFSQFACTSIWFAGNAVLEEVQLAFRLTAESTGPVLSILQFGFILGTLVFAFLHVADRFSPSLVFMTCAILGALLNVSVLFTQTGPVWLFTSRGLTGLMLAGIYPVGMKIASDYHHKGLGKALGYLVGALVVGTAFPHLVQTFFHGLPWQYVMVTTSVFSVAGGLLVGVFVPDGPYRTSAVNIRPDLLAVFKIFKKKDFRSAAFGYFGHMWELYTFWAFLPLMLKRNESLHPHVSLVAFWIIAVGALGCISGGYISTKSSSQKVAFAALCISLTCCLVSPIGFLLPAPLFVLFLAIWGIAVITDSPQFSTLVAATAPKEYIGTALTVSNSLGFLITILSIQLLTCLLRLVDIQYAFMALAIGPVFGLWHTRNLL